MNLQSLQAVFALGKWLDAPCIRLGYLATWALPRHRAIEFKKVNLLTIDNAIIPRFANSFR